MDQEIGVSKFKNIMGITCYMNSILHILQEIPLFQQYVLQGEFVKTMKEDKINESIVFELFKLFKVSSEHNNGTLTPKSFKQRIGQKCDIWNEYQQQDSQEFLNFLISSIEEETGEKTIFIPGNNDIKPELISINKKKFNYIIHNILAQKAWFRFQLREYSLLKTLFDGLVKTKKKCSYCGNLQYVYEPFITLSLSISDKCTTLDDCFNNFTHEERLTNDNQSTCEFCGVKNCFYTQSKLWYTPLILIIHIKRFTFDFKKITTNIEYPINNLNISKYFDDFSPYKEKAVYNLNGINIHLSLGGSNNINAGHYVSYVKNKINNNWYLYNDSNPLIKIDDESNLQNQNAYILFYIRNQ